MNDYKVLKTFLLAAEKRNFAQAARELDLTPAAVIRAIAALEDDLGVQLFVRTTRQVSLTTDGVAFAAQIKPAVEALENARKDVRNAHKADQGCLRIPAKSFRAVFAAKNNVIPAVRRRMQERLRFHKTSLFEVWATPAVQAGGLSTTV